MNKSYNTVTGFVDERDDEPEPKLKYYALLRLSSEGGLDFERIGQTLGLSPTTTCRRGERRGPRSPASRADVWMYQPLPDAEPLDKQLDALQLALRPHVTFLRGLKEHASVRVMLGYSSNVDHGGFVLPPRCLEIFRDLEVDFEVSIVVVVHE
jgi:Domain of unknown function (DUF4279)